MSISRSLVGTMILDSGKLGVVTNEIKSGTWSEEPWFDWTTSYEIKYFDGNQCIMTKNSFDRLVKSGKITIFKKQEEE